MIIIWFKTITTQPYYLCNGLMNYDIDKDFKILSKLIFLNQSVFLNNIYIVHKTIKIYY